MIESSAACERAGVAQREIERDGASELHKVGPVHFMQGMCTALVLGLLLRAPRSGAAANARVCDVSADAERMAA